MALCLGDTILVELDVTEYTGNRCLRLCPVSPLGSPLTNLRDVEKLIYYETKWFINVKS